MNRILKAHQLLHGYSRGHSLIASSIGLKGVPAQTILKLSDLSGPGMKKGFESYLTAYSVPESNYFAIARTWYALGESRPGSVWTHTLLFHLNDLLMIESSREIDNVFKRPTGSLPDVDSYNSEVTIAIGGQPLLTEPLVDGNIRYRATGIISYLYGSEKRPVVIESTSSQSIEPIVWMIWIQHGALFGSFFSFCTGALSGRAIQGEMLSLQISPISYSSKISRRNPEIVIVDDRELKERYSSQLWLRPCVDDLFFGPTNFRHFVSEIRKSDGLSVNAIQDLSLIYNAAYNASDNSNDVIVALISEIRRAFPKAEQGRFLKKLLLGKNATWRVSESTAVDEVLFREMCRDEYSDTFNASDLEVPNRISVLWEANRENTLQLIYDISEFSSPFANAVIDGLASVVDSADLFGPEGIGLPIKKQMVLRNPTLAASKSVWSVNIEEQKTILDTLATVRNIGQALTSSIVNAILDSNTALSTFSVIGVFGSDGVSAILDRLNSVEVAEAVEIFDSWGAVVCRDVKTVIEWISSQSMVGHHVMSLLATMLDANNRRLDEIGTDPWVGCAHYMQTMLSGDLLVSANSFLLCVGFRNLPNRPGVLCSIVFQAVFDAALEDRISDRSWTMLRKQLPETKWWREWDKCELLLRGLLSRFVKFSWAPALLLSSVLSNKAMIELVTLCRRDSACRKFLRDIANDVRHGRIETTSRQAEILMRTYLR